MANEHYTFYTGITGNIHKRVHQHKLKLLPGFTAEYGLDRLLYYEVFSDALTAIKREKQIKKWRREKKLSLIESINPSFLDLSEDWFNS
jgi:putative endonuclease